MHVELSKKDFAILSGKIREALKGYKGRNHHQVEWLKMVLKGLLFAAGWAIFSLPHLAANILGIFVMSYAYISIAITGIHETSHVSFTKSRRANTFWAKFFTDFWTSKSHLWWRWRHVETHHPHTNIIGEEPQPFYFPWMNAAVYFFVVPYAVVPWLISSSIWFLRTKPLQLLSYLSLATLGILFHSSLFLVLGYSWTSALLLALIMRSIYAPIFLHLAVFNHIGLPSFENDETRPEWTDLQSKTTRNIKPNWFLKGIGGNAFLDGHVEHHLFPHLSNHQIAQVREIIVEFLKNRGYIYREESYFACLGMCLKHYNQLFDYLKNPLW